MERKGKWAVTFGFEKPKVSKGQSSLTGISAIWAVKKSLAVMEIWKIFGSQKKNIYEDTKIFGMKYKRVKKICQNYGMKIINLRCLHVMCRLKDLRYFMLRFLRMWMSKWKQPMTVFVSEFCWDSLDEISKMLIFLLISRGRGFFFKILTEIKCSGLHLIPTIYRLTREMGYNWRKI